MYKLIWHGSHGWETIEEDISTREEADYLAGEYRLAYGGVVKVRKQQRR